MARETFIPFLVTMMLVTGVCNTILNKFQVRQLLPFSIVYWCYLLTNDIRNSQDMQCVRNCDSPDLSKRKLFEQPVIQTYGRTLDIGLEIQGMES